MFIPSNNEESPHRAKLFIDENKVSEVTQHLSENNVDVHPYEDIYTHLELMAEAKIKIGYDDNVCNFRLFDII